MGRICGIRRVDRVRSLIRRGGCSWRLSIMEGMERNLIKWAGCVERTREERLAKKVYRATVENYWGRGRPQRRCRNEVKTLLRRRRLNEREGIVLAIDSEA